MAGNILSPCEAEEIASVGFPGQIKSRATRTKELERLR